jgi:hypothetical protein
MTLARIPALLFILGCFAANAVHALYFYLEGNEKKCFIEDLPKETMVIGMHKFTRYHGNV